MRDHFGRAQIAAAASDEGEEAYSSLASQGRANRELGPIQTASVAAAAVARFAAPDKCPCEDVYPIAPAHPPRVPADIDMGADRLWEMALEQNGHADAAKFIRWRWKHGLSLTAAAEALGLSRRTVAYYVSGEQEVPRTVLLALKGWEQEQRKSAIAWSPNRGC